MLISNGALLIFRQRKRHRKMPHANLTYFYWHARLHGRHRKVFTDNAGTLALFGFASSSHWAVQVRWVVNADIVMLRDVKLLHLVVCLSSVYTNMHAYQYFRALPVSRRWCLGHSTHNGEIHFLFISTPWVWVRVYWEMTFLSISLYFFQRNILATLKCHQSGQCFRDLNSSETPCS